MRVLAVSDDRLICSIESGFSGTQVHGLRGHVLRSWAVRLRVRTRGTGYIALSIHYPLVNLLHSGNSPSEMPPPPGDITAIGRSEIPDAGR